MKTQIKNMFFALIAVAAMATTANAQQQFAAVPQTGPGMGGPQAAVVSPIQQNQYWFGMHVELIQGWGGPTLRVTSVTWGSPAQQAGLEIGDEIRTVNGQGFGYARDSYDAVRLMNQFTRPRNVGPAPAAAASQVGAFAAAAGQAQAYVRPQPTVGVANLIVRNVRNGQDVSLTVFPTVKGGIGSGPAPAAAAAPGF